MEQALTRRYKRLQNGEGKLPDILLIDGGKGQLGKAIEVLAELGVQGVQLIGVAKGTTRKAGFETLFDGITGAEIVLSGDSSALHLIQHIRDESHRFAITGHKQRRDKKRKTSSLEDISGIGATRRRDLLRHFGGLQEVQNASINDLARVTGISQKLAEEIYGFFHSD
jgi:excinuclease ABC subunit C